MIQYANFVVARLKSFSLKATAALLTSAGLNGGTTLPVSTVSGEENFQITEISFGRNRR